MKQDQGEQTSMEAAEPDDVGHISPGAQLKAARLVLGLSVSDVSSRLKLSIKKIEALENDDVANIATPVFVAGYLRTYARLLELPEDEVLAGFDTLPGMKSSVDDGVSEDTVPETMASNPEGMMSTAPPSASTSTVFKQPKPLAMAALIALLVIVVVYLSVTDTETVDDTQSESVSRADPVESIESESVQSPSDMDLQDEDPQEIAITASTSPELVVTIEAAPSQAELTTTIETTTRVATDETGSVDEPEHNVAEADILPQSELRLVFNDESWVDVTDARGEKLVYRLAKAGLSRAVTGVAPFDVQLGYAPGVEIFYNGKPYDMSRYASRRSARFRVGHTGGRMTNE